MSLNQQQHFQYQQSGPYQQDFNASRNDLRSQHRNDFSGSGFQGGEEDFNGGQQRKRRWCMDTIPTSNTLDGRSQDTRRPPPPPRPSPPPPRRPSPPRRPPPPPAPAEDDDDLDEFGRIKRSSPEEFEDVRSTQPTTWQQPSSSAQQTQPQQSLQPQIQTHPHLNVHQQHPRPHQSHQQHHHQQQPSFQGPVQSQHQQRGYPTAVFSPPCPYDPTAFDPLSAEAWTDFAPTLQSWNGGQSLPSMEAVTSWIMMSLHARMIMMQQMQAAATAPEGSGGNAPAPMSMFDAATGPGNVGVIAEHGDGGQEQQQI